MPGLFSRNYAGCRFPNRAGLFLDRDGVIVEEINYLHDPRDLRFIPNVLAAIAHVNRLGIPVVMVTNQAGIGRGYFGWNDFHDLQDCILVQAAKEGAHFDMVLACAYHAEGQEPYAIANHPWRKPNPGMILEAAAALSIDLSRSFIIGDCLTDLAAGSAAGVAGGALVATGHGMRDWNATGQAAFTRWQAEGHFMPRRAADAALAIHDWLETQPEGTGAGSAS